MVGGEKDPCKRPNCREKPDFLLLYCEGCLGRLPTLYLTELLAHWEELGLHLFFLKRMQALLEECPADWHDHGIEVTPAQLSLLFE